MDVDLTPSPRRLEVAAGPARISLISPPQDGRMGGVSLSRGSPSPQHLSLPPTSQALRNAALQTPCHGPSPRPAPPAAGRMGGAGTPSLGGCLAPAPRPPISISGLLQRQRLGSAGLGESHSRDDTSTPCLRLSGFPASSPAQPPQAAGGTVGFLPMR
uniref:Ring finger protein 212 n=2 Tax=Rousettus aegyptiacus TaxID=9407 RepID=A0A7J8EAD8_ROUAE|nr:ring finger protein 212 [Rousettus aegyptiacus]